MSKIICDGDGCSLVIVAKCMHCDHHLCLKCLTKHRQTIDTQLCQLTNNMNKLLSLSLSNDDNNRSSHLQIRINEQYMSVMEQITCWEMTMTKRLNDLVSRARRTLQNSFEQISFEIDEWSIERQIELQQLAVDIGKHFKTRQTTK